MKKAGKTTSLFRYDLNQIAYTYTVEVMNRFKGQDLVDRVDEELWTEVHNTEQEVMTKIIPKKKEIQEVKVVAWVNHWEIRREVKGKGENIMNEEFQRTARRVKKALSDQCKEIEENNKMWKTRDLFKKIGDIKGIFHIKIGTLKDKTGKDLTEA